MRRLTLIALFPLLAACGLVEAVMLPVAVIEGASLVTTEKAASDHIISFYSGKDCSSKRKEQGDTYCREDEPNPSPVVHCYRTLGEVTCYDRADPYENGAAPVGTPDATIRNP